MMLTVFVALASGFGAVSYWLLVRRLWAPFLVPVPRDPLAPALWWLAFSVSLYIADRRHTPSSPGR